MVRDEILGREEELAAINRFFDDDRSGLRALLIEGESGIGKTTLWREGLRLAEAKGLVLASEASEAEAGLSFTVLGDLLGPILDRTLEDLPARHREALEAALLIGPPARSNPDARAVPLAVLGVMRSLVAEGQVTILIDDVQWVDRPSGEALQFAFRRLQTETLVIVAARRAAPGLVEPLNRVSMPSDTARLSVGPMAKAPLGRLLRKRLGHPFAPPLVERILGASGGNPFFAVEIGRALTRDEPNPNPAEPLPIPVGLQDLLRDRLSALSREARLVLLVAASSAQPTSAIVERAGGQPAGLDEAEEEGIVALRGGVIEFTHPLLASTVYSNASSRARRDVHARLASITTDPEARARHLALSIDRPDEEAATVLEDAAGQAEGRGAPFAAAELYQLAASATFPEAVEELRRRRHGALGNLWAAGDTRGARDLQQRLLAELEPGPARAHTFYSMASASWNDVTRVTSLLTRALDEVGEDRLTRAWILEELAWAALWRCEPVASLSLSEESIGIANELHDPRPLRAALSAKAMASGVLGLDANELLERGIALEGALDYNELSTSRSCLGRLQMWAGALDSARETLRIELERRIEQGRDTLTWEVRLDLAEVEYRAGRFSLAAEHAREAHEIVVDAGWSDVLGQVLPVKAAIGCAMGDTQQARADGTQALSTCHRLADRWDEIQARSALGFLELSIGDHAAAHAWLEPLVGLSENMGLREPGAFPFLPDEIEALVALGELEVAATLADRLEEMGRRLGRPLALATAARCNGLIAGAHGDLSRADECLGRALHEHASAPQPFERARTFLVAGVVRRRMRQRRSGRERLKVALDLFTELGAPLWAAKAKTELARIGGRAATPDELTGTEHNVVELAAHGLTNREIADRLFISVKTVEANLSRAYQKLGVRSRRELSSVLDAPIAPVDEP